MKQVRSAVAKLQERALTKDAFSVFSQGLLQYTFVIFENVTEALTERVRGAELHPASRLERNAGREEKYALVGLDFPQRIWSNA